MTIYSLQYGKAKMQFKYTYSARSKFKETRQKALDTK